MTPVLTVLLAALGGYLLGSVPFGLVFTRLAGLGDIRSIGSGNIGATNVLRTGRKDLALATLICDSGKGAAAVIAASMLAGPQAALVAGTAAFLGHLFPVWLGFKGGKGVATFLGTILALDFIVGLLACATWLLIAAVFRISSLSALVATALTPVYFLAFGEKASAAAMLVIGILIFWRHSANIQRLLAGDEPKIGAKKDAPPGTADA